MATLVTRELGGSPKGSPLTNAEIDQNIININAEVAANLATVNASIATKVAINTAGQTFSKITLDGTGSTGAILDISAASAQIVATWSNGSTATNISLNTWLQNRSNNLSTYISIRPAGSGAAAGVLLSNSSDVDNATLYRMSTVGAALSFDGLNSGTGTTPSGFFFSVGNGGTSLLSITSANGITIHSAGSGLSIPSSGYIKGEFSTTPISSRTRIYNSVINEPTYVTITPNGTGTAAGIEAYNTSAATAGALVKLYVDSSAAYLSALANGGGSAIPLILSAGGNEGLRVTTSGRILVNTSTDDTISALQTNGSITIVGTARRIYADMSATAVSDRLIFVTSTASASTTLGLMPTLASGGVAQTNYYGTNDPTNAPRLTVRAGDTGHAINTTKGGSGTTQSLGIQVDGTNIVYITAAGSVALGKAGLTTTSTDGMVYISSCAGVPTGVPTAITDMVAFRIDRTNAKGYIYVGGWVALN
jgi:hypothetical protein